MSRTILLLEDNAHGICAARKAEILDSLQDGQKSPDYLKGLGEYSDRQRFPLPTLVLLNLKRHAPERVELAAEAIQLAVRRK